MAQTGYTPIQLYYSSTTTNVPLAASLANGELAINITDGKLFYKDNAAAVQVIGWKTVPTSAGGTGLTSYTAGDLTYYASGTAFTKLGIGTVDYVMTSSGSAPQWSASLKAKAGGTGQTSYAVGDLLYADTTTTLAKLADVATGNALISGGVSTAPSWGKIGLTTHVSGTLGVTNGGTGTATAFTAGSVIYAGASGVYSQDNANLFYNASSGNFGIGTNSPAQKLHVQTTANSGALQFGGPTYYGTIEHEAVVTGANIYTVASASGGGHIFKRGSTTLTSIDASGNETISIGNLVIGTSGKGIDFSATPNTGTSELFADYEEGTWTPNQGSGLVVVGAFSSSGTYTKIGRVVTATGILFGATSITVTATSAITSNLPYTSATGNSTGACINAATTSTTIIYVAGATVYSTAATAASTYIFFLITYQV